MENIWMKFVFPLVRLKSFLWLLEIDWLICQSSFLLRSYWLWSSDTTGVMVVCLSRWDGSEKCTTDTMSMFIFAWEVVNLCRVVMPWAGPGCHQWPETPQSQLVIFFNLYPSPLHQMRGHQHTVVLSSHLVLPIHSQYNCSVSILS